LAVKRKLTVADFANDVTTGIERARQLIEQDQVDFIAGDVNSAVAPAITRVTAAKPKLHVVTGGHTDEITSSQCGWNVFRVCKSTTMEANAIADTLIEKFGARWYFLTPDYVYGQTLQAAFELKLRQHGGAWASAILPIGAVDYSDALTNAAAFRPKVLIDLMSAVKIRSTASSRSPASGSPRTWRSIVEIRTNQLPKRTQLSSIRRPLHSSMSGPKPEANPSAFRIRLRLCLIFKPPRENPRIALAEGAGLSQHGCKVCWR
jgi:hypothetical protein